MQDKILYEYAVIRIVPKVEREEFINAGIMIYSKDKNEILIKTYFDEKNFDSVEGELDKELVQLNLRSLEFIAKVKKEGGPIAQMDTASRFRWMTAGRSSFIKTSRPHPRFSEDLEETLHRLFEGLILLIGKNH